MKKVCACFIVLVTSYAIALSQKQYNNWYFGNQAAINFNTGTAVNVTGNAMNMIDCPASISDSAGNLLFYSSSTQVWDRSNQVMPNGTGISGNLSGGQPANILRMPCSPNLYYLFTNDAYGYSGGLRYSVIDMNLNGGLGDVVASQKNVLLLGAATEQVLLVKDANGHDAWLIAHPTNTGNFYTYHITSAGVNATPVISTIGAYRGNGDDACGQINIDPSNSHLAVAHYLSNQFELYDFNNATGVISNLMTFNCSKAWGLEFSPDGSKLYVAGWTTQYVNQYDLSSYTQSAISSSVVNLGNVTGPGGPYYTGYMQLAPDNKIYIAVYMDPYLAVVNNPNVSGTGCNLVDNGFNLGGPTSSAGLPDKVVLANGGISVNIGNDTTVCPGQTILLSAGNSGASYLWSNGASTQNISVTAPGTYWVQVTSGGCIGNDSINITTGSATSPFSLGADTTYCGAFSRTLSTGYMNTLWSTGVTSPQITVTNTGSYWASVNNGCGSYADTITISDIPPPAVYLGEDTTLCNGTFLVLNATNPASTYLWQDNSTNSTYTVLSAGAYSVIVTNQAGCSAGDTIHVAYTGPPAPINLGNDTAFCGNFTKVITTGGPNALWSTGAMASQILVNTPGQYWANISNACGSVADTINIAQSPFPIVNLGNDTTLCNGDILILNAGNPGATYNWQDNSTTSSYTVMMAGNYSVTVTSQQGCKASDTVNIAYASPPQPFTINADTSFCGPFIYNLIASDNSVLWSTGVSAHQITVAAAGVYWAKVSNTCGIYADTVTLTQNPLPVVNLGNDTTLCQGQSLDLRPGNYTSYLWQDNSSGSTYHVSNAGIYSVQVTNSFSCIAADTITVGYDSSIAPINLGPDTLYCGPFSRTLTTGITNTLWSTQATGPGIVVNAPATYWAVVSNTCGYVSDTIVLSEDIVPSVNFAPVQPICPGDIITLQPNTSAVYYLWDNGNTASTLSVTQPGNYSVEVWNDPACKTSASVVIAAGSSPVISLGGDTTLCSNDGLLLSVSAPGATYQWQDGSTDSFTVATLSGTYSVTVTNNCGSTSAKKNVTIYRDECALLIPTGFSPNDDGENDIFHAISRCPIRNYEIRVYNRWGEMVFESEDITVGWDGTYQGRAQPVGVYVYQIAYYNYCKGTMDTKKGNVTLLR